MRKGMAQDTRFKPEWNLKVGRHGLRRTTTEGCCNSVMSWKGPNLEGTYDGEATMNEMKKTGFLAPRGVPEEGTQKGNQLRRQAQRERTKELRARYYSSLSHRLDPDEIPPGSTTTRPRYKMNEFSCYDCMKPIKTGKHAFGGRTY